MASAAGGKISTASNPRAAARAQPEGDLRAGAPAALQHLVVQEIGGREDLPVALRVVGQNLVDPLARSWDRALDVDLDLPGHRLSLLGCGVVDTA